jgi:hypothetical protein
MPIYFPWRWEMLAHWSHQKPRQAFLRNKQLSQDWQSRVLHKSRHVSAARWRPQMALQFFFFSFFKFFFLSLSLSCWVNSTGTVTQSTFLSNSRRQLVDMVKLVCMFFLKHVTFLLSGTRGGMASFWVSNCGWQGNRCLSDSKWGWAFQFNHRQGSAKPCVNFLKNQWSHSSTKRKP